MEMDQVLKPLGEDGKCTENEVTILSFLSGFSTYVFMALLCFLSGQYYTAVAIVLIVGTISHSLIWRWSFSFH